jgi:hypothetical protein
LTEESTLLAFHTQDATFWVLDKHIFSLVTIETTRYKHKTIARYMRYMIPELAGSIFLPFLSFLISSPFSGDLAWPFSNPLRVYEQLLYI